MLDREREPPERAMFCLPPDGLLQLTLDGPGAAEQPPVHLAEPIVGGEEHESARHPDGDADRAPVELDGETLIDHDDSTPGGRAQARANARSCSRPPFK